MILLSDVNKKEEKENPQNQTITGLLSCNTKQCYCYNID